MIYIGIDPAVAKQTAVAIIDGDKTHLLMVDTFDPNDLLADLYGLHLEGPVKICIEAQTIYKGSKVKTKGILELANRSGFFEALLLVHFGSQVVHVERPEPCEWKGQVPSDMYRKRILRKYPDVDHLTHGMTKVIQEDLCHAFGLAKFLEK
jgi:hypothetical protein